jgi:IS4 transposase
MKRLVYPLIKIPLRHNASVTTEDVLDILIFIASRNDFCNNGTNMYKYNHKDKRIPKGDTILYHLSKLQPEYIRTISEKAFDVIFKFAKREYPLLKRRSVDIAFDIHEIPFYGNKNEWYVSGGKFQNGTAFFYKFITCAIVVAGKRFTLDAQPFSQLDNLTGIMDRMIKRAKSKVHINYVYMDRGFDCIAVYNLMKKFHLKYLMPKTKSDTVKEWMDKAEGSEAYIVKNFKIGRREKSITTTLVLVNDEDGLKRIFATNINVGLPIAHRLGLLYSKRWGIETAYRQMDKDFKPRTTSTNYNLRLLYFFFTVILFNLWVLVNICVSEKLYGKLLEKPIIASKMFLEILLSVKTNIG